MYFSEDELTSLTTAHMEITTHSDKSSDDFRILIAADAEDHCIIVVMNHTGRIVRMKGVNVREGNNEFQLDNVSALEPGIYQINIKDINSTILYSTIYTKH